MNYTLYGGIGLVMLGVGQVYITTVIGVLYPAFMSFVALESEEKEDDKQWLTYWVVYGLFQIIDQFGGIILGLIPFYFFLKLIALVLLFHPSVMGAVYVYDKFFSNMVKAYRGQIEGTINNMQKQAESTFE